MQDLLLVHRHLNYLENRTCEEYLSINSVSVNSTTLFLLRVQGRYLQCCCIDPSPNATPCKVYYHLNYLQNKMCDEDLGINIVGIDSTILFVSRTVQGVFFFDVAV